jgi:hypothetical protein
MLFLALFSCHHDDGFKIERCLPSSLKTNTDSIVFEYDNNKKLTGTSYYLSSRHLTASNEFEYDNNGRLVTLKNYDHRIFTNDVTLNSTYTLEYDSKNLPSVLHINQSSSPNMEIKTEFTHDDQNRLSIAAINLIFPDFSFQSAGFRYEYDDNDNVVKIYYQVRLNNNKDLEEVLARENLTFDDHPVFYKHSSALTIANVYLFNYVPNNNNCLSAKVYYPDYQSHFTSPQEFEFLPAYNKNGLVTQLIDPSQTAQLYFNEVLFNNATYQCN